MPPSERDLRHLLPRDTARVEAYVSPNEARFNFKTPPRDRQGHGNGLRSQLDRVLAAAEAMQSGAAHVEGEAVQGLHVTFRSEPHHRLLLDSLESQRSGIELLAVHPIDGDIVEATVFIPEGKVSHFYKLIDAYLTKQTKKKGEPRNRKLIESISEIRLAVAGSLWTDDFDQFPGAAERVWWEVWLRVSQDVERFRRIAEKAGLEARSGEIRFPDRIVTLVLGTREQLAVPEVLDCVAELRRAKEVASNFTTLSTPEQQQLAADFMSRVSGPNQNAPAVCVLDTGVNEQHPMLVPFVDPQDAQAYRPAWGAHDHHGHGTEMAGLALYGDLTPLLNGASPVSIPHRVESVKILPPVGANPPELYGSITQDAVARAEIQAPDRRRTICMAVTTTDFRDRGQPSSWSAAVDAMSSGAQDDQRRLVVLSAGNTDPDMRHHYPSNQLTEAIHDPAQSWNALTVGAYTELTRITDPSFAGWSPLAQAGAVAPCSTTSVPWNPRWPIKPDVVMEGGNMAIDTGRTRADYVDSLQLLTTYFRHNLRPLVTTGDTSAAAALGAGMGARISAEYRDLWPETIRALIVHSADWTPTMRSAVRNWKTRTEVQALMRCAGYGVPNLQRALWSARDALTLIVQEDLQPFTKRDDGRMSMKDMHLHELPWPIAQLRGLGSMEVEMRVTLSYFIEPNPARRGWTSRHRYASHGLRFDVKTPTERLTDFRKRLNRAARDEDEQGGSTSSGAKEWLIGPDLRNHGSVHSDRWIGTATALAERSVIGVFPVIGWWRERPRHERWGRQARYALVVSVRTKATNVDIYTPVETQIANPIPT
jgi:hypothetical protein